MAARDVLKNLNLFVDGRGYAGQCQEFNPPKLTLIMEEARMGGMDAAEEISLGMEKLEADFTLISYDRDVLAQFGLVNGATIPLTVREYLESHDGTITAVAHVMRGRLKEVDPGTHKPGQLAPVKFAVALNYYKLTHGGTVLHEIDVSNMVRVIDGVDQLADARRALGM